MANIDPRVKRINQRLKGTPLAGQGRAFVAAGKRNGVDPLLLVAISGAESSFGKHLNGAFNPFGWGPGISFKSFGQAINTVARGLRRGYLDEGRTTVAAIGAKWAPGGAANDPTNLNANWAGNVGKFYSELGGTGTGKPGKISAPKPTNLAMPKTSSPTGMSMPGVPPQALGTLNDIFRKVGLKPLDIVGDLPLPVPGRTVTPPPVKGAAPAQPLGKVPKMPRVKQMVGLIEYAQKLGLRVSENPYVDKVDPVHTKGSHHYQAVGKHKGKKVGRAIDVSGDPKALERFWAYAERFAGQGLDDLFWDPKGYSYDRGRRWNQTIGNHDDHIHASIR